MLPGAHFATDNTLRINGMPSRLRRFASKGRTPPTARAASRQQTTQPGVDAIQEVSVQTSNYAAEYGQVGGGFFNYTMKSGTNQFHGTRLRLLRE